MNRSQWSLLLCGAGCSFWLLEHYCQLSTLCSNWSHLQCCSVVMGRSMSTTHPSTANTINQSCMESREPEFGCFSKPELLPGDSCLKGTLCLLREYFFHFFYIYIYVYVYTYTVYTWPCKVQGESFKRSPQPASYIEWQLTCELLVFMVVKQSL